MFRAPAHPRYLLHAVRQVAPFVQAAAAGRNLGGGVRLIPDLHPILRREAMAYRDLSPAPWREYDNLPVLQEATTCWAALMKCANGRDDE